MKLIIILIAALQMLFSSDKYKEPKYEILNSFGNIEVREYGSYVVARTSLDIAIAKYFGRNILLF